MTEIQTIVEEGIPVYASGIVRPPERDVGIMGQYVEGLFVTFLGGEEFPGELSEEDERRIVEELVAAYNDGPCD